MQFSNQIAQICHYQWSSYMKGSQKWMANIIEQEAAGCLSYININELNVLLFNRLITRVQNQRSIGLNIVAKKDIWDSKNFFRNKVYNLIKSRCLAYHCETCKKAFSVKKVSFKQITGQQRAAFCPICDNSQCYPLGKLNKLEKDIVD